MFQPTDHVASFVDDYLHGLLSDADAVYLRQHCDGCEVCKEALAQAQKRFDAVKGIPPERTPEPLLHDTVIRLAQAQAAVSSRWRFRKFFYGSIGSLAAAAAIVIAIMAYHYETLKPSNFNLLALGQSTLLRGGPAALRIRLLHNVTKAAIAGVPVDVEVRNPANNELVKLASFKTDSSGSGQPRFNMPEWNEGTYQIRVTAHTEDGPEIIEKPIQLKRSWQLMLSTDKPVYQPGQTIHIRSLGLRRPDLKPVGRQEVIFTIADPKGNIIFKRHEVTSDFGIASADCDLASEIIEGDYKIECKVGDTVSKSSVEVKKYVLPKFKITADLDQPYYQPGHGAQGTVQVDYFFGKPVAGGVVELELTTVDLRPQTLKRIETKTDDTGKATFSLTLPDKFFGREQDGGDARFVIHIGVTDSAGQSQARSVSRTVTTSPLRVEVIPEAGSLVRDVANTIYFWASYADGRPAPKARISVSGAENELVTNELGVATMTMIPTKDDIGLTIRVEDGQRNIGRKHVTLKLGVNQNFLVRTDKAVYSGGETVKLTALGGGVEPIFVDFVKDGQTMLTESIEMKSGKGETQFDVPPDLFGTVELSAYRFQSAGLPVRTRRILYVRPAKQLTIDAKLDHQEYRPGESGKLTIHLTDDKGKPTPGAVSLAAVDEAVYAVLDQAPGMEKLFFLLEQQLLKPVYAIYPWSPDLLQSESADRKEFEQALFSRTSNIVNESQPEPAAQATATTPLGALYTLLAETFPAKVQEIDRLRRSGQSWVNSAWKWFFVVLLLMGYFSLWELVPARNMILAHLFLGPALFWLLVALVLAGFVGCSSSVTMPRDEAKSTVPPKQLMVNFPTAASQRPGGGGRGGVDELPPGLLGPLRSNGSTSVAPSTVMSESPAESAAPPPRLREWFPETLLWKPEVITDEHGVASVNIELADSITTWRLMASAVAADGRLGGKQEAIRVFQPFFVDLNLPVALTRNDEISVPVVVYNYLDKPQTVELKLNEEKWFTLLDVGQVANLPAHQAGWQPAPQVKRVELAPGEVKATSYRLRVNKVGLQHLQVTALGSGVSDAIKKEIEVVPDGRRVEVVSNGSLLQPAEVALNVPAEAIDGSVKCFVKIYPSTFSQLVEGLDGIFRQPYGCFEQTSSTTYPNVLALQYLKKINKTVPEVDAKARQYIHLGYQRLLGFEISGGGFDWFGRPPANQTLTAYGLLEFTDMANVHDVDPKLIERTRQWLLARRQKDGAWNPEGHGLHMGDPTRPGHGGEMARLSTTAYVAWAVFQESEPRTLVSGQTPLTNVRGSAKPEARATLDYLLAFKPESISDPYVLALVCNALLAIDPSSLEIRPYLDRLDNLKQTSEDGKLAWWQQAAEQQTMFYGSGRTGGVETTALAAMAFLKANVHAGTTKAALTWLTRQKDGNGTWYGTQSTVLALKALIAGTGASLGNDQERRIEIRLDNGYRPELVIPADQAEVMQLVDLSDQLAAGEHKLTLSDKSSSGTGYQVVFRHHVPGAAPPPHAEPLAIDIKYDRTELLVGDTVKATATVVNQMQAVAPMVILDLPVPGGFAAEAEGFAKLVSEQKIAKFQITARSVIVYLRGLEPGKPLTLDYKLNATMPVKVAVPPAQVYEYYNRDKRGASPAAAMTVRQKA